MIPKLGIPFQNQQRLNLKLEKENINPLHPAWGDTSFLIIWNWMQVASASKLNLSVTNDTIPTKILDKNLKVFLKKIGFENCQWDFLKSSPHVGFSYIQLFFWNPLFQSMIHWLKLCITSKNQNQSKKLAIWMPWISHRVSITLQKVTQTSFFLLLIYFTNILHSSLTHQLLKVNQIKGLFMTWNFYMVSDIPHKFIHISCFPTLTCIANSF